MRVLKLFVTARVTAAVLLLGAVAPVLATLPAPTADAKAAKDEAAARTDHAGKVAAFKLCQSQNRVAEVYLKDKPAAAASAAAASIGVAACTDPGAYVQMQEAAKIGVADALPLNKEPVRK
jgi:hypothetical protein